MKKLLLLGLLLVPWLLSAMPVDVPQASVSVAQVPVGVAEDDAFVRDLVAKLNNDRVHFRKGKLSFWVEPSVGMIILGSTLTALLGGTAVACLGFTGRTFMRDATLGQRLFCAVCILLFAVPWVWCTRELLAQKNMPCIGLSNQGLYVWGKKLCGWHDLDHVKIAKPMLNGCIFNIADLQDKYGTTVLSVNDRFLHDVGVSIDCLLTCIAYYWKCNRVTGYR